MNDTKINTSVEDYKLAVEMALFMKSVDDISAANHMMLERGKITLEQFLAGARIISQRFLEQ